MIVTATLRAVSGNTISTTAGEWQTLHLADGSVLRAGPRTRATVTFSDHDRIVRLLQGEAMIHVEKDGSRPFYLETELATVRAVGTAFAVRRFESDRVVVTVQEGRVAVTRGSHFASRNQRRSAESATVSAGEQVRVTAQTVPLQVRRVDLRKELAWVAGELLLTTETIGDAVREFNLRNETQIKVLSPRTQRRSIRGVFEVAEPRVFALYIATSANLTFMEDQSGTLLLMPKHPPEGPALSEPRNP
jgi:transmembrane sensor